MEDAAFFIGVVKFSAVWSDAPTGSKKCLSAREHAHRRSDEIDPQVVPIVGLNCWSERSGRIRAHPGERYSDWVKHRDQRANKICRVRRQSFMIGCEQDSDHQKKRHSQFDHESDGASVHTRHCYRVMHSMIAKRTSQHISGKSDATNGA